MEFHRLLPAPAASVELQPLLDSLRLEAAAPPDRPYTIVNFVASVDGRSTLGGRSGGLGDDGDHAMFHGLREQVDAVLAGVGTMATERYGRMLSREERRLRRADRGLAPEPLACMVTRSGAVPTDIPLFGVPEARVLLFAGSGFQLAAVKAQVEVIELDRGELTLTTVMRRLRADHGVRTLLCEGGPTLFGAMLHEDLVDELFLTVAPKMAGGGDGLTITAGGALPEPREMRIEWLLERHESLFLRYSLP